MAEKTCPECGPHGNAGWIDLAFSRSRCSLCNAPTEQDRAEQDRAEYYGDGTYVGNLSIGYEQRWIERGRAVHEAPEKKIDVKVVAGLDLCDAYGEQVLDPGEPFCEVELDLQLPRDRKSAIPLSELRVRLKAAALAVLDECAPETRPSERKVTIEPEAKRLPDSQAEIARALYEGTSLSPPVTIRAALPKGWTEASVDRLRDSMVARLTKKTTT